MGMVNTSMVIPGSHPVNCLIIIAVPEIPPGAILNGARKISKLMARIRDPIVNKI
jgi:hypothetical protein